MRILNIVNKSPPPPCKRGDMVKEIQKWDGKNEIIPSAKTNILLGGLKAATFEKHDQMV